MCCKPCDEANKLLNADVLRIICQKVGRLESQLCRVPCQSSSVKNLREFLYVRNGPPKQERRSTSTHCSDFGSAKDSDGLRTSAGANQNSPTPMTKKIYGLSEEVDLGEGHWSKKQLLDGRFSKQLKIKSVRLQRFSGVPWRYMPLTSTCGPILEKRIVLRNSSGFRNVTNSMIS